MLAFSAIADTPLADDTEVNFIQVPSANIAVSGITPDRVGSAIRFFPPAANINFSGSIPVVASGVSLKPEQGRITLIKRAPAAVSTGVKISTDALLVYDIEWKRPRILTGIFSERRIKFVILRQTGGN